ncbi:Type IV fimbrial biogenesis protein PilW [hydrothermal vent metagenome]|uniref:Type IV fimbrial biogenesis protein PilW n=1 Tax=hydrothermal vent metagenome TaxID=652676 RepID=A0A3B1BHQ8_9ZZZZ
MSSSVTKNNQHGVTLVELLIAVVLSLFLVGGILEIFISNNQLFRVQEAQSRVQENARFALEFLPRNVREAGFSGCRPIEQMNVQSIADAPMPAFGAASAISGHEATTTSAWAPVLPASISGTVIGGTDVLTIQKGSSCGATLTGNLGASDASIQITAPNSCGISPGDALMIADCEDAHIFRATNVLTPSGGTHTIAHEIDSNTSTHFCINQTGGAGACGTGNAKLYSFDAELLQFTSVTYFIRTGFGGRNALWMVDNTVAGSAIEMVEGIENMQVTYGIDTNADDIADSYETADNVTDWSQVISAEIRLLLETQEDSITTGNQTYTYNNTTLSATDRRLRRVFTTTVGLRNRIQ